MVYSVNGHAYQMPREQFKNVVNVLKERFKGVNVILAVVKEDVAIAKNDVYFTKQHMLQAIDEWRKQGYEVFYNLGKS